MNPRRPAIALLFRGVACACLLGATVPILANNPLVDGPVADFSLTGSDCPECLGADLMLEPDDGSTITAKGATDVYDLVYTNRGVDLATGVVLTATVPENATFAPDDSSAGWRLEPGTAGTYTLDLFDLEAGETGAALFAVTVSTSVPVGTVISFTSQIADDGLHGPDKTPDDNTVTDENLVTRGPTFVCGTIDVDTTWMVLDGPYIVTCDVVVPAGVTLTLEPGTVVKFNSEIGMLVFGTLLAEGTAARTPVFTSNRSRLRRGDWDGIDVYDGGEARFEHARLEYGGSTLDSFDAMIYAAAGATVSVRDSTVAFSDEPGLWSDDGLVTVEDSTFRGNDRAGVRLTTRSRANVSRVEGNTFVDNRSAAIEIAYVNGATGEVSGNGGSGNTISGVQVSGTMAGLVQWGINPGLPYVISTDLTVTGGGELRIDPGAVVKLETGSSDLIVDGILKAIGTEEEPIVFTSIRDDTIEGDTNNDAGASAPAAGDWGRIYFRTGSLGNRLEQCAVAYGANAGAGNFGQIRTDTSELTVIGCTVRDSAQVGLYAPGAAPEIRDSRFESNGGDGVHARFSSTLGLEPLILDGNTFLGNGGHAAFLDLTNATGGIVLAGNAAAGNATNGAAIRGSIHGDFTVDSSEQVSFALRLVGDLTVTSAATLTLTRGTVVKGDAAGRDLHVFGRLVAAGTAGRRVVFTSFQDDSQGGDTNGDGGASSPMPGDWGQVWLRTGSIGNELSHTVLAYGGAAVTNTLAALRVDSDQFTLSDALIQHSAQHGLYASKATFDFTGVRIEDSADHGALFDNLKGTVDLNLLGVTYLRNGGHAVFLDLEEVAGQMTARDNVAADNGIGAVGIQGTVLGDLGLDWSQQVNLPLALAGDLTVRPSAGLTLSPGVVFKGSSGGQDLQVWGSLIAAGTLAQPVVFTSIHDDAFGGDTGGDGDATAPAPGDWGQIRLRVGSTANVLSHCVLAYGGATGFTDTVALLRSETDRLQLSDTVVRDSAQSGIWALSRVFDLTGATIENNVFSGVVFTDLAGALDLTMAGNTFRDNGDHAVFLDFEEVQGQITAAGNTATGNATNGVAVGGTIAGSLDVDWSGQAEFAWRLTGDLFVRRGATLSLSRGTVIKAGAAGHDLDVRGTLIAEGTAFQPVIFTSLHDDGRGGDTGGDGGASSPAAGDWGQVFLRAGSWGNSLRHVVFAYGGANANLRVDTEDLILEDALIEHSAQDGIYGFNVDVGLTRVRLENNAGSGLHLDDLTRQLDMTLEDGAFVGNGGHAVDLNLQEVHGQITASGNTVSGNGVNGIAVAGVVHGPLSVDLSAQSDLALRLNGDLTVRSGATLDLSPGTVVKGGSPSNDLHVFGSLVADGTATQPVVFTSLADDSYAGDTGGDGTGTSPAAGDWGQVWLRPGSSGHVLRHFVLAWGGSTADAANLGNLRSDVSDVTLADGIVRGSARDGLLAQDASFDVTNVVFESNATSGLVFNFLHGQVGATLTGNTFMDNGTHAVFFDFNEVHGQITAVGNGVSGNGFNTVGVRGNITGPFDVDWSQQSNLAIRLHEDVVVTREGRLTLSPGTIWKGTGGDRELIVDGNLIADGTSAQPIVFTSIRDDTWGGDSNGDGAATSPAPGDWGQVYLRFRSHGNRLSHCVLAYGGAGGISGIVGNLRLETGAATIASCSFENSAQRGLYANVTTPPSPITASNFTGNVDFGLENVGVATIDARGNWWGSPSGPFHPTLNPTGTGDAVSDNVLFDPWQGAVQPRFAGAFTGGGAAVSRALAAPRSVESFTLGPVTLGSLELRGVDLRSVTNNQVTGGTAPHTSGKDGSPPLPAGFYGTVTAGTIAIPEGILITAWIDGVLCAEVPLRVTGGVGVYALNVPGDEVNTAPIEGGVTGDTVVFKIAGADADQTASWRDALYERLDLTTTANVDLSISQDNGTDQLAAGEVVSYVLTVSSSGAETATGVTVTDTLPANTSFVAASDGGTESGGTSGSNTVTWPAFDLASGSSVTRIVTVQVDAALPAGLEQLTNAASVRDDANQGIDATPEDNDSTDTDTVDAAPDLAITKTDGLDDVVPGAIVRYSLTIENVGTQAATGMTVSDTLPPSITFFAASGDGIENDGVVDWPPVELAAGDNVVYEVTLRLDDPLPPSLLVLNNAATVTDDGSGGADLDPSNNSATDMTTVIRLPDLTVPSVDISAAILDLETLDLSGSVLLDLENRGNLDSPSFEITVFEDGDGDGAFIAGTDTILGQTTFGVPLAAGQTTPFAVSVSGALSFRGSRIFAFADSAEAVAELDETNNVGDSGAACQAVPTPEDFNPVIEMRWPEDGGNVDVSFSRDTISTPIIVPLTDDNGDGRYDENDVPSIVFVTINLIPAIPPRPEPRIRAIRGDTGAPLWDAIPPISSFLITALTGAAAGDIDNDGLPEIIFSAFDFRGPSGRPNRLLAYEHNGFRKWTSSSYSTHPDGDTLTNRDNPSIADLDGDGVPEIIVGANVFNNNGSIRWRGTGGHAYQSVDNLEDPRGGAISVVANLDLVGDQEIVTGNTAYRSDGSILWQIAMDDGYPAVANFDADPNPEIVVVARGRVRLHEHDGTLIWGPIDLPGAGPEAGGAPTVADFDGDGEREIGVAGSTTYTVFEDDGSVKWQSTSRDASSAMTGSTVFDLDGDGLFEVIYRDEQYLRVYRGADGVVLFEEALSSQTFNEEVVVADVDRDGNAEIIISSDRAEGFSGFPARTAGIRVFGDANDNWVGTRTIWNQHQYHVDNVGDDASIPSQPAFSWLTHNTFRAQVAPPEVSFSAPDLTASRGRVDVSDFPATLGFTVRVGNAGTTFIAAGLPVAFYDADPGVGGELIATTTIGDLEAGGLEDVSVIWPEPRLEPGTVTIVVDDDGTGQGFQTECDEANNVYAFTYDLADVGLFLSKTDGQPTVHIGDPATYFLEVTNYYPSTATGVGLSDTVPANTSFSAASDGGAESGGTVTWPAFDLGLGETATRTLTVQVADTVPQGVRTITNTATVTDDGSLGPDPTPQNNTATDVDDLLVFRADANGPYSGGEGESIPLDASGTVDPEGQVTAYEWDLDGDGFFNDAAGPSPSVSFDDEGSFTVFLRVTALDGLTDFASAQVDVSNVAPAVDAGADRTVLEGDPVGVAATYVDPGRDDTQTATIDWDDGTVEPGTVGGTSTAGTVSGSHVYPDEGDFTVEVCVADNDGAEGCDSFATTVENAAPVVQGTGTFDLGAWRPESHLSCYDGAAEWIVAPDGSSVTQTRNSVPTLFYSNFLAVGTRIEGSIRVTDPAGQGNGDFVGFALGYRPGDTVNPDADYLVIDWRREDQAFNFGCGGAATGSRGLAVSRVTGIPADAELWAHDDRGCNGFDNRVEELARGANLGSTGWEYDRDYAFTLVSSPNRLQVFVDGVLEADLEGEFPDGRVAFYGYSQGDVVYSGFSVVSLIADEGRPVDARVTFTDAGVLDTHTATLDWGDGSGLEPGTVAPVEGGGVGVE
ncbi:MAG: DUF11 domain-containing protein, partial [bacterium]|nr:DUF11 domain-containing protein [bacterium]